MAALDLSALLATLARIKSLGVTGGPMPGEMDPAAGPSLISGDPSQPATGLFGPAPVQGPVQAGPATPSFFNPAQLGGTDPGWVPPDQAEGLPPAPDGASQMIPAPTANGQIGPTDPSEVLPVTLPQGGQEAPQAAAPVRPQAPNPLTLLGPPPNAPRINPVLGAADALLTGGVFSRIRQGNYKADQANYANNLALANREFMMQYGASLPREQQPAFWADPQGYIKNQEAIDLQRRTPRDMAGGNSLMDANGLLATAPRMGIDEKSGVPFSQTTGPNGFTPQGQLSGGVTANNGLIINDRTGVTGAYSTPQKLAPGETPAAFAPIASGFTPPGALAAAPQLGQPPAASPAPSGPIQFMAPVNGQITSGFGPRARPMAGATTNHGGIDYGVPVGTPVSAAATGTVTFAGPKGGFGNTVEITHPDGTVTRYGHLSNISVQRGQAIAGGQPLGASGDTGTVTGPNLHFAVLRNGRPVNPKAYMIAAQGGAPAGAPPSQAATQAPPGWTVGQPAGARYDIVDGSTVPGGKPGERYRVGPDGKPEPLAMGTFSPQEIVAKGDAFMKSPQYMDAANAVSAVNAAYRATASVPPGAAVSMATIDTSIRALNPGVGVRGQTMNLVLEHMGWSRELISKYDNAIGQGFVDADTAKEFLATARSYAESHLSVLNGQHQANVEFARSHGFTEADLGESMPQLDPMPTSGPVPMRERVAGRVYSTPKGPLIWTGSGWQPVSP